MQGKCVRATWDAEFSPDTGETFIGADFSELEERILASGFHQGITYRSDGMAATGRYRAGPVERIQAWLVNVHEAYNPASSSKERVAGSMRSEIARRKAQVLDTGAK